LGAPVSSQSIRAPRANDSFANRINLGIVERVIDENDRRQKNLAFTKKGFSQYRKLKKHLNNQIITYTDLFDEIECDLSEVILSTMDRIEKWTLPERQKTRM